MADLTTLRLKVRYRLGNRDDLTTGDGLTLLDEWINDAYEEIAHSVHFHVFESEATLATVVGERRISLASQSPVIYAILSAHDVTNDRNLDRFSGGFNEYERVVGVTNGDPIEYLHYGTFFYMRPPPSAIISIRLGVRIEVTRLTTPGSSPLLPIVWHRGIEILAARNGWRGLGDDARAAAIEQNEWRSFRATVRTPRAIEAYSPRRRGVRTRMLLRDRAMGV